MPSSSSAAGRPGRPRRPRAPGCNGEQAAANVTSLTKLNWNFGHTHMQVPATLAFVQKVGRIMVEVTEEQS